MLKAKTNSSEQYLDTFLSKNRFFVPGYQRSYTWNQETAEQLLDDLLEHLNSNPKSDYYISNIVVYRRKNKFNDEELVVVDGQQRITSFMLLITAIRVLIYANESIYHYNLGSLDQKLEI